MLFRRCVSFRKASIAIAGLALAVAAIPASPADAKDYVISMQITGFEPAALTVKAGDRITWINKDLFPHTATADDKTFDSNSVAPAGSWTYTAGNRGTHTYTCIFHPTMKASITVR